MTGPEMVKPEHRSTSDESWSVYLRRVWPDLADILLRDPAVRAHELADEWVAERLRFASQSFGYCHGLSSYEEVVGEFLKTLEAGGPADA